MIKFKLINIKTAVVLFTFDFIQSTQRRKNEKNKNWRLQTVVFQFFIQLSNLEQGTFRKCKQQYFFLEQTRLHDIFQYSIFAHALFKFLFLWIIVRLIEPFDIIISCAHMMFVLQTAVFICLLKYILYISFVYAEIFCARWNLLCTVIFCILKSIQWKLTKIFCAPKSFVRLASSVFVARNWCCLVVKT